MTHREKEVRRSAKERDRAPKAAKWRLSGLTLVLLLLLVPPVRAARGRYQVVEVKPHVFVYVPEDILDYDGDSHFALAGTAGFVVTNGGVVVINTTNSPDHASELLYEIRQRTDQPVTTVINTDARGDHMLGNEVFVDQKADIISSAEAVEAMKRYHQDLLDRLNDSTEESFRLQDRMRGIHFSLPNRTFSGHLTLSIGGVELRLEKLGPGPSPGDFVVYLPASRVLFMGDLYEDGSIPALKPAELPPWLATLHRAEQMPVDVFVPGHGAPGTKKDLEQFQSFLEWAAAQFAPPTLAQLPLDEFRDGRPLLRSLTAAPAASTSAPAATPPPAP